MIAIDLFCGVGGFTEGARAAGCKVIFAADSALKALLYFEQNHPETPRAKMDLTKTNFDLVPKHDLLLTSHCCQGFTDAKGKEKPGSAKSRETAWAVPACAEVHKPTFIVAENVLEFLKWDLYPVWEQRMNNAGYTLSPHVLDAADFGIPQNRERVYIIGTRSKSPLKLKFEKRPHVAASTILDNSSAWRKVADKCDKTRWQVENGRRDFGPRFLLPYYGSAKTGRSLHRPLGTVTTRDRYGLIDGENIRMLNVKEYRRAMGFPDHYILPDLKADAIKLLGNAVCPPEVCEIIKALK